MASKEGGRVDHEEHGLQFPPLLHERVLSRLFPLGLSDLRVRSSLRGHRYFRAMETAALLGLPNARWFTEVRARPLCALQVPCIGRR
jgi:hypothetical protein